MTKLDPARVKSINDRLFGPGGGHDRMAKAPKVKLPKYSVTRIRINRDGYDSGGRYWGVGLPLFLASNPPDHDDEAHFRAEDSKAARALVKEHIQRHGNVNELRRSGGTATAPRRF